METLAGLILAIIIAFIYSWVMTLVVLLFVPLLALGTVARYATLYSHTSRSKKALLEAGKVTMKKQQLITVNVDSH